MMREIAGRVGAALKALLQREAVAQVVAEGKRSKKERVSGLREIGKEWRYPELARRRSELGESRHDIRREFGVTVSVNQDLESDYVECTFREHKARRYFGIFTLIRGR